MPRTHIRRLRRDEVATVTAVLDGLSPASRVRRFHAPVTHLTPSLARVLTDVDDDRHVALVAEVRERGRRVPVGIARYVREPDGSAEVAIAVVDRWQGTGIGTQLMRRLVRHATANGVQELKAELLADNEPVRRLLKKVLPATRFASDGRVVRMTSLLDPSPITVEDVLADLDRDQLHPSRMGGRPLRGEPAGPAVTAMDQTDTAQVELTDCAELVDDDVRCLAPAVLERLAPAESTDGPVEMVATRCLLGHTLRMPASMLVHADGSAAPRPVGDLKGE